MNYSWGLLFLLSFWLFHSLSPYRIRILPRRKFIWLWESGPWQINATQTMCSNSLFPSFCFAFQYWTNFYGFDFGINLDEGLTWTSDTLRHRLWPRAWRRKLSISIHGFIRSRKSGRKASETPVKSNVDLFVYICDINVSFFPLSLTSPVLLCGRRKKFSY